MPPMQITTNKISLYFFFKEPMKIVNDTIAEKPETSKITVKEDISSTSTTDTVVKSNTDIDSKAETKTNQSKGFGGMKKGFLL